MRRPVSLTLSFVWLSALLVGCGDNGGGDPGTITVTATGVTGGQGKLLITEARIAGRQAAISCIPITADPFSATVILETIVGPTPCEVSSPITLDPGTYDITSVVIMGGSMTPERCATGQVTVDGDVTLTVPALTAAACN